MIGQYSNEEMTLMISQQRCISSVLAYIMGNVSLVIGKTVNFYRREEDRSWTNYDCKTIS